MSAVQKLPVEYVETPERTDAPVVTLLHSDISDAYLDDAEPSPVMLYMSRLWHTAVRTLKWAIVLVLVGGYPAAMLASHEINSEPVVLSQADNWATHQSGIMLTLIGRELTGPGWAADRSAWHPQAHLSALPAWQNGVASALSDMAALIAVQAQDANGVSDADLLAASRLLATASDVKAVPRLNAASEAIQSYDSRLNRDMAVVRIDQTAFLETLTLYKSWLQNNVTRMRQTALQLDGWPASREDIGALYSARAQAHVASLFLSAAIDQNPELVVTRDASEALNTALETLRRIADFEPLFVSSQGGTNPILADHPAMMAFYLSEAETAMTAFENAIHAQPSNPVAFAETRTE